MSVYRKSLDPSSLQTTVQRSTIMSDLVSSQPIELIAAEADMVAGGINLPNVSVNV